MELEWKPDAGKIIFVDNCHDFEVEPLLRQLRPEGLLISTTSPSVERGKEPLRMVERMTGR